MKNDALIPIVVEKNPQGFERSYDIYSRLLKDFIVFVTGPIDMAVANTFIAQLLYLESVDPEREISVYINSPGGMVTDGLAMYDTMRHVRNEIATINVGLAASMGSVILSGGTKGKRFALPESKTMIHQVLGGVEGQASDIEIAAKETLRVKSRIIELIAENSGKKKESVEKDMDRNYWMNAKETKEYGLIDKIMTSKKK
ncbi:ATP-dependent Clp protease proteolytic subunit [Patescibacteria group bacterium]